MPEHRTPNTTCEQCGKAFYVRPGQRDEIKRCSMACQRLAVIAGIPDRFWAHVDKSGGPDACWLWMGAVRNGYGAFTIRTPGGRKVVKANRYALILSGVDLPDELLACHDCPNGDNPLCCNPSHLFAGSSADNTHDAQAKGRIKRVLFDADVAEAKRLHATGTWSYQRLAEKYGCGASTVRDAIKGYTWRDVA